MADPPRILWLKTGPLHPLDTGGKLRTYNMLRELAKTHRITYLSLWPPDAEPQAKTAAAEYSHEQEWIPWRAPAKGTPAFFWQLAANLFSPLPYVLAKYRSPAMTEAIQKRDGARRHDLIVGDFLTPAVNLFPAAGGRPATPTLLFEHNVESQIWRRLAANSVNPLHRWYFHAQWQKMRRYEGAAAARFDAVVGVSEADVALLRREYALTNVLGSVPTGVDVGHFAALPRAPRPFTVAFLGSMDWMPNIDAVTWLAREIFPLVRRRLPQARCLVIGRNPPPAVRALGGADSGLEVTGTVPDVRPFLGQAEALVVPLRVGGGTRIKIFEAMAAGLPVISTPVGAEGLPVTPGDHILLAETAADFAALIGELLEQPALRQRIGQAGQDLVRSRFGWDMVTRTFSDYCAATARRDGRTLSAAN